VSRKDIVVNRPISEGRDPSRSLLLTSIFVTSSLTSVTLFHVLDPPQFDGSNQLVFEKVWKETGDGMGSI
jgi:hypothetical protein